MTRAIEIAKKETERPRELSINRRGKQEINKDKSIIRKEGSKQK